MVFSLDKDGFEITPSILSRMEVGALRVIPGSYQLGRLNAGQIAKIRAGQKEIVCSVRAGDVLLMRPLLLHASSEALSPQHRRVIHLEYARGAPGACLEWAENQTFPVRS